MNQDYDTRRKEIKVKDVIAFSIQGDIMIPKDVFTGEEDMLKKLEEFAKENNGEFIGFTSTWEGTE